MQVVSVKLYSVNSVGLVLPIFIAITFGALMAFFSLLDVKRKAHAVTLATVSDLAKGGEKPKPSESV